MANSADLDEVAHYEPSHQDLRSLQIQLFSSLVFKELISYIFACAHSLQSLAGLTHFPFFVSNISRLR